MWTWEVLKISVEPKSGESSDEDEEKMGAGNFTSQEYLYWFLLVLLMVRTWLVMVSCLKQVWTVLVGPKIKEMSPSTKEKIRDDVQNAMAEEEEGKLLTMLIWKV